MIQLPSKPGNGFALGKTAGDIPVNDPYQAYNQSVVGNDEIWQALTTEAGRQALGAQMAK